MGQSDSVAPIRSLDQRLEALQKANHTRVKRAQLKENLKTNKGLVLVVLEDPPEYLKGMKLFDLLMALPKFGRVKAARFLNQARISQVKTVGGLSERQRKEVIGILKREPYEYRKPVDLKVVTDGSDLPER